MGIRTAQLRPMRFGDTELLVETAPVAGTEPTSSLGEAAGKVVNAMDQVDTAIVAIASSVADTVTRLAAQAVRPDRMEVEFGLKFSAKGNVFVVEAAGEAALRVLVEYQPRRQVSPPQQRATS